jgi:hypothetical protein
VERDAFGSGNNRNNPDSLRLAALPEEWSSARWYMNERAAQVRIDPLPPHLQE